MHNVKRFLCTGLATIMFVTMTPLQLFAKTFEAEARTLYDIGFLKGRSATSYEPDLESFATREEAAVMIADNTADWGFDREMVLTEYAALGRFSDTNMISEWALPALLELTQMPANKGPIMNGHPDGRLDPKGKITGKQFMTLILRQNGYRTDFQKVGEVFASAAGVSETDLAIFNVDHPVSRGVLAGILFYAFNMHRADEYSLDPQNWLKPNKDSGIFGHRQVRNGKITKEAYEMHKMDAWPSFQE